MKNTHNILKNIRNKIIDITLNLLVNSFMFVI